VEWVAFIDLLAEGVLESLGPSLERYEIK